MEHQTGRSGAVEAVSHDGAVQAQGMGAVDAQLVGAACERLKGDEGVTVTALQSLYLIM